MGNFIILLLLLAALREEKKIKESDIFPRCFLHISHN